MITPLIILKDKLPQELLHIIQSYLSNDIAEKSIDLFLKKITIREQLYNKFIYYNYIFPNCYCYRVLYPSICIWCYKYIHTYDYTYNLWYISCINNKQINKYINRII